MEFGDMHILTARRKDLRHQRRNRLTPTAIPAVRLRA